MALHPARPEREQRVAADNPPCVIVDVCGRGRGKGMTDVHNPNAASLAKWGARSAYMMVVSSSVSLTNPVVQ